VKVFGNHFNETLGGYIKNLYSSRALGYINSKTEGMVVAVHNHGGQDDYLSMKISTKFREAPARS